MRENAEPAEILFEPLSINALTIANRIVMGPMAVLAPLPDGRPSDQTIAFLCERAKGGVGMIILGGSTATRRAFEESPVDGVVRMDDERFVPDLKRTTDAVHAHGTPIIAELDGRVRADGQAVARVAAHRREPEEHRDPARSVPQGDQGPG